MVPVRLGALVVFANKDEIHEFSNLALFVNKLKIRAFCSRHDGHADVL